jgi:hypothetical protein
MKPGRSPWRRAFWVTKCARFITRRDILFMPPRGALAVVPVTTRASAPADESAGAEQHQTDDTGHDAVLGVHMRVASHMAGEEARQLIGRHQEIHGGNHEQDNAKHGQNEFHEWYPPNMDGRLAGPASRVRFKN